MAAGSGWEMVSEIDITNPSLKAGVSDGLIRIGL